MNEDLKAAGKFNRISLILFSVFFIVTISLIPFFAYRFSNYWLLFGIIFSFFPHIFKSLKLTKIFFLLTIAEIIYWFNVGFNFSDEITFFWVSFMFGYLTQAISKGFNDLADKIISNKTSEMTSEMSSQIINGIKFREKLMGENNDDK